MDGQQASLHRHNSVQECVGTGSEFGTSSVTLKALHRRYAKAVTSFPETKKSCQGYQL